MGRSKVGREYGYAFGWRRSAKFLGLLLLAMLVLTSCKLVSVRKVDPSTGKVIYEQVQAVNSSATNQKFNLSNFNATITWPRSGHPRLCPPWILRRWIWPSWWRR